MDARTGRAHLCEPVGEVIWKIAAGKIGGEKVFSLVFAPFKK